MFIEGKEMNIIIIHYSEIGTKGENRPFFERILANNVRVLLNRYIHNVSRKYGRIVCKIKNEDYLDKIIEKLKKVPGIAYFSPAIKSELNIEQIKESLLNILQNKKFNTFKVITKRSNKMFPMTSIEVNKILGEYIVNSLNKKVNLISPDIKLYVEICEKEAYIYLEKFSGLGGLPVSSSGKVISLLSGGIDSPVASFLMMKRGCQVIFTHFYNRTLTSQAALTKIDKIVRQLTEFQIQSKLYIVPFQDVQYEIIANIPSNYRMIVYRRFMMRIANKIADLENAKAIVTGDSVGQVASQTLENLGCIYQAAKYPVLSPLVGLNKNEIIQLAKNIGTYDYSILPYPDCCSFMVAKHPETSAKLEKILKLEENLDVEQIINKCLQKIKSKLFKINNEKEDVHGVS